MSQASSSSHPVTSVQHGMIFHHVSDARAGVDIEQCVGEFNEALDLHLFERSWREVSQRHEVLRARFRWEGLAQPVLEVLENADFSLVHRDLRGLAEAAQVEQFEAFLREDRKAGFDLSRAPLQRVTLFQLGNERFKMVWTYSHTILDSAVYFVLREVLECYAAYLEGREPSVTSRGSYTEHLDWLSAHLKASAAQAEAFWRQLLDGFTEPTSIPARSDSQGIEVAQAVLGARLSRHATDKLQALSREHGLSLNNFVQGAWALILAQHSGSQDVVFGATRGCRRSGALGAENAVGLFINTPPLRIKVEGDAALIPWLQRIRQQNKEIGPFENTPLVDIQRCSRLKTGEALFESIIVFSGVHNNTLLSVDGLANGRSFDWIDQTNFPVTLLAFGDPELLLRLSFQQHRVSEQTIQTLLNQLLIVLADMAEHPEKRLKQLELLGEQEKNWLAARQGKIVGFERLPIHVQFERQVQATPEAVALTHGGVSLTYRQLNHLSNEVASQLRGSGLTTNACVGIYVTRSLEMLAGLLGILKAGGAYVPLDPEFPRERLAMMIEDSKMSFIVAPEALQAALPSHSAHVVNLPSIGADFHEVPNLELPVAATDLAYVIFTSGSTGRPKGVMLEHEHVANFFVGMDERLGTAPGVWLAVTSISFDISVLELFWTLTRGFHVVLQNADAQSGRVSRQGDGATSMEFGLFYFGGDPGAEEKEKYRLLLEGAMYADAHDFASVWTPERHFHEFGGLYPNPAITGAAIAACTKRIHIRAGSVVAPLHHPVRLAEEWAVVDNISGGRVGFSVASGWHPNDFVLATSSFEKRRELMFEHLDQALALWRGESLSLPNGVGQTTSVQSFPRPIQKEPPIWITAGGSPDTFENAGKRGANILTNLLVQSEEELRERIVVYRAARKKAGFAGPGNVTLMLHTFLGDDEQTVKDLVREPLKQYLKTATALVNRTRWELTSFATGYKAGATAAPQEKLPSLDELSVEERDAIMEHAFNRYFSEQGLFGTPESCVRIVEHFRQMGVTEIASLIDFGLPTSLVLEGLTRLNQLRLQCTTMSDSSTAVQVQGRDFDLATLIHQHGVTHFQCTPSMARMVCADADQFAALQQLKTILLGGEALPLDLATQITSNFAGRLLNMYGPTETTVWSSCALVPAHPQAVTIGSANANTTILLLDDERRQVAPGVIGEIYIGGESVARGYFGREDLTRERFVLLEESSGQRARYYRTGDLGRYRTDGEIEFLGRVDHQVKVSGYRIELGEIESVLSTESQVREVAVVARNDVSGTPQLVAYVVAENASAASDEGGLAETWREAWDQTYSSAEATSVAADMDTAGWISAIDGEKIPEPLMEEWVEATVKRVLSLRPRRILEVGCGTGMLALRLAPFCEHYTGFDFSPAALARLRTKLDARGVQNVSLECKQADALGEILEGGFDTVIVNSVAQYFPTGEYLLRVVEGLLGLVRPRGHILFGDIRNLEQQRAFCAAVELARAEPGLKAAQWAERVAQREKRETELLVSPKFFENLPGVFAEVSGVSVLLRPEKGRTEMSRFRFDAVLTIKGEAAQAPSELRAESIASPEALLERLQQAPPELLLTELENDRVAREWKLLGAQGRGGDSALETLLEQTATPRAFDPGDFAALAGYTARLLPARSGAPERFDVYLSREGSGLPPRACAPAGRASSRADLLSLIQAGVKSAQGSDLTERLRQLARRRLPPYMVPSVFVTLEQMPLTPNGKLDRARLPKPEEKKRSTGAFQAPASELENIVAGIWKEMLNLDRISIQDNFFDLGANSLMMVQAQGRLNTALNKKPSLVDLFRFPTVERLAKHLAQGSEAGASEAVEQSTSRGNARREAMMKRREQARTSRGV